MTKKRYLILVQIRLILNVRTLRRNCKVKPVIRKCPRNYVHVRVLLCWLHGFLLRHKVVSSGYGSLFFFRLILRRLFRIFEGDLLLFLKQECEMSPRLRSSAL